MKLLVCIAFHHNLDRLKYLFKVIDELVKWPVDLKVIVDTNKDLPMDCVVHNDLQHPFHLTWMHRKHIKENIDNFDCFMYIEDDMLVSWENFKAYLEKFYLLYPNYIPSFIRIEEKDRTQFISDVPEYHKINEEEIVHVKDRMFTSFKFPHNYHAFWIMPQKELKESMKDNFIQLSEGREFAASYTAWELGKKPLVEIYKEDGKYFIDQKCYSYHLPNNYALGSGPNGQIPVKDILI